MNCSNAWLAIDFKDIFRARPYGSSRAVLRALRGAPWLVRLGLLDGAHHLVELARASLPVHEHHCTGDAPVIAEDARRRVWDGAGQAKLVLALGTNQASQTTEFELAVAPSSFPISQAAPRRPRLTRSYNVHGPRIRMH